MSFLDSVCNVLLENLTPACNFLIFNRTRLSIATPYLLEMILLPNARQVGDWSST
jgi:hypothetical protein